jgi:HD-GYP domain-containing protein (c-di-GMP phosphodiesterase class II)
VEPTDVATHAHAMLEGLRRHDPLTRAHSERVRVLAEVIGASLGLTAPDREKLRVASLLHDIGKLAVPRHILNKGDEPTDSEWEVLRAHPDAAEGLLAPIRPWLGEWVGAATEHHERFDGGGYPRGLAREEITLAGRIVAVADAYDCIVSTRSYKAAVPPEQARAELAASSGAQFDPDIVRALLVAVIHRLHPSPS